MHTKVSVKQVKFNLFLKILFKKKSLKNAIIKKSIQKYAYNINIIY